VKSAAYGITASRSKNARIARRTATVRGFMLAHQRGASR